MGKTLGGQEKAHSSVFHQRRLTAAGGGGAAGGVFGWSVAISGTTAVIGAPDSNQAPGIVYVFVHSGSGWSQQAELTDPSGLSGDDFGFSVAVSGSTVMVGALGVNSFTGAAYVFVRSGTVWSLQAELTDPSGSAGDQFGFSVALSGSAALVGAWGKNS